MADDTSPIRAQADARPTGILDEPNEDRSLMVSLNGDVYARHPVRTHLVTEADDAAARELAAAIGVPVAIIDANDAGCNPLGISPGVDRRFVARLFADNPLGQAREQTPICVVRRLSWPPSDPLPPEPRARLTPP